VELGRGVGFGALEHDPDIKHRFRPA